MIIPHEGDSIIASADLHSVILYYLSSSSGAISSTPIVDETN